MKYLILFILTFAITPIYAIPGGHGSAHSAGHASHSISSNTTRNHGNQHNKYNDSVNQEIRIKLLKKQKVEEELLRKNYIINIAYWSLGITLLLLISIFFIRILINFSK